MKKIHKTNEELIKDIKEISQKLNRAPTVKEYKKSSLAIGRYGSWKDFLAAADLEMKERKKHKSYTKEELIEDITALAKKLGRTPKSSEYKRYGSVRKYYGSWKEFIGAANLPYPDIKRTQLYSDEDLIEEIRLMAKKLKRTPVSQEYVRTSLACRRFGGWTRFIELAGLEKTPKDKLKKYTNDNLIREIQELTNTLKRTPLFREYVRAALAIRRFGSWYDFLDDAGIDWKRKPNVRYTNEYLIQEFLDLKEELGYVPSSTVYVRRSLAAKRFGSWNNFIKEAGLEVPQRMQNVRMTKKKLIKHMQNQVKEQGEIPSKDHYEHTDLAAHYFFSWNEFLSAAGFDIEVNGVLDYTDEDLITEIKKVHENLNQLPEPNDYIRSSLAIKRYGTWNAFLLSADIIAE